MLTASARTPYTEAVSLYNTVTACSPTYDLYTHSFNYAKFTADNYIPGHSRQEYIQHLRNPDNTVFHDLLHERRLDSTNVILANGCTAYETMSPWTNEEITEGLQHVGDVLDHLSSGFHPNRTMIHILCGLLHLHTLQSLTDYLKNSSSSLEFPDGTKLDNLYGTVPLIILDTMCAKFQDGKT